MVNYHTLQRHANLLVELNHERAQHARERINAWKAHCAQQQQAQHVDSSGGDGNLNSDPDTACKEYDALVEMGPGITALVMLEYSKDQTGPWFLLMHHFVYEKPLELGELGVLDVKEQYARWKDWMELGEERHELAERLERGYVYNFYIRPGTTLVGGVV